LSRNVFYFSRQVRSEILKFFLATDCTLSAWDSPTQNNHMDWGPVTKAATRSWQWIFLQIARLTLFEPGPLCEDSLHLAGNSIFDNLESLKPWVKKKRFENLKIVVDGAVKCLSWVTSKSIIRLVVRQNKI
jgi:hypothetical protein